jgi:hypothetical protein
MLAFRRTRRSSVGGRRQHFDTLADKVYAICQVATAQRRGGLLAAGPATYNATVLEISRMPEVRSGEVPLSEALAVLSDITARCQNRYEDAS